MQFEMPAQRPRSESVVPMINIVFLLLIFFLMTAQIAPPAPFEVTPPEAENETPAEGTFTLHISPEGTLGYADAEGDRALKSLAAARESHCQEVACDETGPVLLLRVDGAADGAALAKLMGQIGETGFQTVKLVTRAN